MKILHIISDWKWTGPAEPVVNLCAELQRRGHDVTLAIARVHGDNQPVLKEKAIESSVKLFEGLTMRRRINMSALRDVRSLAGYMKQERFDIVHTHLTHDHALVSFALMGMKDRPVVVRTSHKGLPLKNRVGNRFLMRHADALITVSRMAGIKDALSFSLPSDRVAIIQNAIDLERFVPRSKKEALMEEMGIKSSDVVVGIVARLQRHRRYEVFLEAMKLVSGTHPHIKAIIVGRGTYAEEVAYRPVREMGLEGTVILAGYRKDDYMDVLALFDMKVFLVPGSDGSCRAARELMAMGKPVIAANRGMLPEIIDDGINGLIIEDSAENLAAAIIRLAENEEVRKLMGSKAREMTLSSFSLEGQGERVENFYSSFIA